MKRGVTSNLHIWNWRQMIVVGRVDDARASCSIVAYNQANEEIARRDLSNAWPSRVVGPGTDEADTDFMVEELVLVHGGLVRVR